MKLLEDRENIPVLECLYHSQISFWKEPIQATCEELVKINKDTMMEGQIEFAMSASIHLCRRQLVCGMNLMTIKSQCTSSMNEMVRMIFSAAPQVLIVVKLFVIFGAGQVQTNVGHHVCCVSTVLHFEVDGERTWHSI